MEIPEWKGPTNIHPSKMILASYADFISYSKAYKTNLKRIKT